MGRPAGSLLSVVAPVYNEEDTVDELVRRIVAVSRDAARQFEIVLVDDGSRDQTLPRLIAITRTVPELRVVALVRNFGYSAAQAAGLAAARGDATVIMDGDLQDPPEVIPDLLAQWKDGADVVYAVRRSRQDAWAMKIASRIHYWLLARFADTRIPQQSGTFSLLDRRVVDTINALPERTRYFVGLRAWASGQQAEVLYDREHRQSGHSRLALAGRIELARHAYVSFSKAPLRGAAALSLVTALFLLVYGGAAVVIRLVDKTAVPGWAATTVLLGIMGTVQSLVLAVIAEYVGVIFDEVKGRPLNLVRQEYGGGKAVSLQTRAPASSRV